MKRRSLTSTLRLMFLFALIVGIAHAEPIKIVALGASNTFGKGVSPDEAYPAQLERLLRAAGYDVVVKNEGTNGQTTADELGKLDSAVPDGVKAKNRPPGLAAAPATNLVIVMLVMFWFIKGRVKGRVSMLVETGA